jgi:hypothetical protein
MVLFWLMWLCLALGGTARLIGAEGWVGLWLAPAPETPRAASPRHAELLSGRWPPAPRFAPRAGPPGRLTS